MIAYLYLLLSGVLVSARAEGDTSRATVGSTVCFQRVIPAAESGCTLSATIVLSNPTVWYPRSATIDRSSAQLKRVSDTMWYLSGEAGSAQMVLIDLCGTVLAGSDSICIVTIDSLRLCSRPVGRLQHVLVVHSIGPPLPYIRFAHMEGPYPLPAQQRGEILVFLRFDAASTATLRVHDVLGRQHISIRQSFERGIHRIELALPESCTPGLYLLSFESTTGHESSLFVVE